MATPYTPIFNFMAATKLPLSDASMARLFGATLDDYCCYLVYAWSLDDEHGCREAWRAYLASQNVTLMACDRLLKRRTNPRYKQAMTFFLWFDKKKGYYHGTLLPNQIKALLRGLELKGPQLLEVLGVPENFGFTVPTKHPARLADRLAVTVTNNPAWMALLHRRIARYYGWASRTVNLHELACDMMIELPRASYFSCEHLLQPSQQEDRRWNGQALTCVAQLLEWPLEEIADELDVPLNEPAAFAMPELPALPAMGRKMTVQRGRLPSTPYKYKQRRLKVQLQPMAAE